MCENTCFHSKGQPRFNIFLDLQIFSSVRYFKKININSTCFHKTIHNKFQKRCFDKSVGRTENGLEQGEVNR